MKNKKLNKSEILGGFTINLPGRSVPIFRTKPGLLASLKSHLIDLENDHPELLKEIEYIETPKILGQSEFDSWSDYQEYCYTSRGDSGSAREVDMRLRENFFKDFRDQ